MISLGVHKKDIVRKQHMNSHSDSERIEALDVTLFDRIDSQTTEEERRSILGVQRAVRNKHDKYAYLEIGSHLGGSIQPFLRDRHCTTIFSIDARPFQQPDDRGVTRTYLDNSTSRMLRLLRAIDPIAVSKIRCFDMDAKEVDLAQITPSPVLALIDGEHTEKAVLSDFQFCRKVIPECGTILFHDFQVIFPAILSISGQLRRQGHSFIAMKFDGSVFGIFFDTSLVQADPFLAATYSRNRRLFGGWRVQAYGLTVRMWLINNLPSPVLKALRKLRSLIKQ